MDADSFTYTTWPHGFDEQLGLWKTLNTCGCFVTWLGSLVSAAWAMASLTYRQAF